MAASDQTASVMKGADAASQIGLGETGLGHCYNSMEQIFSPIQINKGGDPGQTEADVPQLAMLSLSSFEDGRFSGGDSTRTGAVGPTRLELDPYFSQIYGDDGSNWIKSCDFHMMVNDGKDSRYNQQGKELNIRKVKSREDISSVRVGALRGPLIVSGWGYDLADRPTPWAADDATTFFPGDVSHNRASWSTGPVDLKWDIERKVWSGGTQIVCGVLDGAIDAPLSPCTCREFTLKLLRMGDAEFGATTTEFGETIIGCNRDPYFEVEAEENMVFVICARINYEWMPIWCGKNDQVQFRDNPMSNPLAGPGACT
tara:strand:+ start:199 stop:1140 length:942 start_codon:yes stop_codon:yes gene_type:complete